MRYTRPRRSPIQTAARPRNTCRRILAEALMIAPSFSRASDSNPKVEKVVNPPNTPMKRKIRMSGPSSDRVSASPWSSPMSKHPRMFTVSVPTGKPNAGLNRLKAPAMTNRLMEPRNPPNPTNRSCGNPYGDMVRGLSRC